MKCFCENMKYVITGIETKKGLMLSREEGSLELPGGKITLSVILF